MEWWEKALLFTAACVGMLSIVPLMVWGGTGDWRHAWHACKSYLKIMGAMVAVGGGFGLFMAITEHGFILFR